MQITARIVYAAHSIRPAIVYYHTAGCRSLDEGKDGACADAFLLAQRQQKAVLDKKTGQLFSVHYYRVYFPAA